MSETRHVPWKPTDGTTSTRGNCKTGCWWSWGCRCHQDALAWRSPSRATAELVPWELRASRSFGCEDQPPSQQLLQMQARSQAVREASRAISNFIKLNIFWQNISILVSQQPWKAPVGSSEARGGCVGEGPQDTHATRPRPGCTDTMLRRSHTTNCPACWLIPLQSIPCPSTEKLV